MISAERSDLFFQVIQPGSKANGWKELSPENRCYSVPQILLKQIIKVVYPLDAYESGMGLKYDRKQTSCSAGSKKSLSKQSSKTKRNNINHRHQQPDNQHCRWHLEFE